METRVLIVDPASPDPDAIQQAAEAVREGRLVAFPTETVYGLGANALDPRAVSAIFTAKGRPANNPVILHVADIASAQRLVTEWPETANQLAGRFWPGPLTFVLPKADSVPGAATGGGVTVAVRAPAHPVARALLLTSGLPIAAPSANRSMQVSPTRAAHVLRSLEGQIDLVLDGGSCPGGIESTVLDLTATPPRLLRPGLVTVGAIEYLIGPIQSASAWTGAGPLRSPGMMERHYAPDASLELGPDGETRVQALAQAGLRVGWMRLGAGAYRRSDAQASPLYVVDMPDDASAYSARLYDALHTMDEAGVDRIIVDEPPDTPEWLAVRDRLRRAAAT